MKEFFQIIKMYFFQVILWYLFFIIFKIGFWAFNYDYFDGNTMPSLGEIIFKSLRFDFSAIAMLLIPFVLAIVCYIIWFKKWILQLALFLPSILAFLFEIGDWLYFPFNHKRSTAELLSIVGGSGDFLVLLPSFFREFYYIFIIAFLLITLYIFISNKLLNYGIKSLTTEFSWKKKALYISGFLVLTSSFTLVALRGGLQLVPINIRNAVEVIDAKYAPLVLNTPFSILHSLANKNLEKLDWLSEDELEKYATIFHPGFKEEGDFTNENVIIIVLESFSKDFTYLSKNETHFTPFLDSLMQKGELYMHTYANGLHSAEGIPAILASIPSWMSENFTSSIYGSNKIHGIASLLKKFNYSSAFFHGANNGSMGFDVFARNAGFDKYFGRNEYPYKEDYDGAWGIFDKPFFQYSLEEINKMQEPFVNCIFSVTSHSPYPLPKEDAERLSTKDYPIYGTIQYTDEALRDFFEKAKLSDWYENTWFIITADHTSPMNKFNSSLEGFAKYEIPLVFFHPQKSQENKKVDKHVSQLDIMPILLKKLQYPNAFYAFGTADLSSGIGMMAEINNQYYIKDRIGRSLIINEQDQNIESYLNDISEDEIEEYQLLWKKYQAYRQLYNNTLITNSISAL